MKILQSTALNKYGINNCEQAHKMNKAGNGASTIGFTLGLTTNQADSAINTWRWIIANATVGAVIHAKNEEYVVTNLSPLELFQRI